MDKTATTQGRPPLPGISGGPALGFDPPADVSHIRRKWLDIAYATTSPAQQLDIYLPESGEGPFPVIFYTHGGAFAMGDKRDIQVLASLQGLERGYAVVGVNYRLSGEAVFPAALQDVKAAVRWVRARGAQHGLDPGRIAAFGASAGGNLAAMLAVTTGLDMFDDPSLGNVEYATDVQVAVEWFGPTDFLAMDRQLAENGLGPTDHSEADSPESRYLGAQITEVPEKVVLASPLTYVSKAMAPILIQHGSADNLVPVQQSIEFARVTREKAGPQKVELDILNGAGHGDPAFATPQNMTRVFDFMDRYLCREGSR